MDQLEENVGYKVNGTCLRNATLQQLLLCPAGQESLPADQLADHCQVLNVTCPAVSTTPPEKAKKKRKGYACRRQFDEKSTIIPGCPGTIFNAVDAFGCCVCLRLCCIPVKCLLMSSDASLQSARAIDTTQKLFLNLYQAFLGHAYGKPQLAAFFAEAMWAFAAQSKHQLPIIVKSLLLSWSNLQTTCLSIPGHVLPNLPVIFAPILTPVCPCT